ncbi:MAG TPA: hypothetical protein VEU08_03695 [Vicinamibacterales bacterium]|nr:hypothetical protein [Vicinamibacterales bacterium]
MTLDLDILKCGNCEELKIGVHAGALGLAVVMGVYNAAAWLVRREPHLAVNAIFYAGLVAWEREHVAHHLAELRPPRPRLRVVEAEPQAKIAA